MSEKTEQQEPVSQIIRFTVSWKEYQTLLWAKKKLKYKTWREMVLDGASWATMMDFVKNGTFEELQNAIEIMDKVQKVE